MFDYKKVYVMSEKERKDTRLGELWAALAGLGFILMVLL